MFWNFRTFFRNLSGKNLMWSVIHWLRWLSRQPNFNRQSFQKIENPILKWRKNASLAVIFFVFGWYECSCIGFDYFLFNFDAFLKFWGNPEIQDGRSKMAAIWQSWRNDHFMYSPPPLADLKANIMGRIIYPPSYGDEKADWGGSPPPSPTSPPWPHTQSRP